MFMNKAQLFKKVSDNGDLKRASSFILCEIVLIWDEMLYSLCWLRRYYYRRYVVNIHNS